MRIHPEWLTDDIKMIIFVERAANIDIDPHLMDKHMIGIVALNLNIFRKMKIGMIFCHVISHPIPPILKYLPTFTNQKCIGAIPIFMIIAIRIKVPPESDINSLLVRFMVVMYINMRIEAIVWDTKKSSNFSDLVFVDTENRRIKEYVEASIIIHIVRNDFVEGSKIGLIIKTARNMLEVEKLFIYKKEYYQWGMNPLAFLAYLIL